MQKNYCIAKRVRKIKPSPGEFPMIQLAALKPLLMRLQLVTLLVILAFVQVSARVNGQTITVKLENETLDQAFKKIEQKSGYDFIFVDELKDTKKVSGTFTNASIKTILDHIFKDQPYSYEIIGRTVAIKPKKNTTQQQTEFQSAPPQDRLIEGAVFDEKGTPLSGVTVTIKGSTIKTVTGEDGKFKINVEADAILVFAYIGYKTREVSTKGGSRMAVGLDQDTRELSEIKIGSTGYQFIPKERATGSFYKVDNALIDRTVGSDIISRIEKVTSGLQLYRGQLTVRGRSTIFANQNPLIVVDNFPYDGDISRINPNDIESITTLKDAAAASIWGALSGNGVIVITTKSGRVGQPLKVNVVSTVTVGKKPDLYYNQGYITSGDYIDLEKFLFDKGYYNATINNNVSNPGYSPVIDILARVRNGSLSSADGQTQINTLRNNDVRNDISKYFYRTTANQQYAVNLSGGTKNASFYVGLGFDKSNKALKFNDDQRYSYTSQFTFTPLKGLEISTTLNLIQSKRSSDNTINDAKFGIAGNANANIYPYARLADDNGSPLPLVKNLRTSYLSAKQNQGFLDWQYFPLKELGLNKNIDEFLDSRINLSIRYKISSNLSLEGRYQNFRSAGETELYYAQNSYFSRNIINTFTSVRTDGSIYRNVPLGGILANSNSKNNGNSGRVQMNYNFKRGKSGFNGIAGIDIREAKTAGKTNTFYGYNPANGAFKNPNLDSNFLIQPSGTSRIPNFDLINGTLDRYKSYYANFSYEYSNKYVLSLSGRIDQSNLFGYNANQRSAPLWSTGIKWNIENENFYNLTFLPKLSLRATYGFNGNLDKTSTPLTLQQYSNLYINLANVPYSIIDRPGNPELTWEKIGMYNFGIDFTLGKEIVSGSVEYYHKSGSNMIGDDPIDPTTGFSSVTGNFSNLVGKGLDVVINSNLIKRKFNWFASFLFSYANNTVTKYKGTSAISTILEGRPASSLFVNKWMGLDPNTGSPRGELNGQSSVNYSTLNALKPVDKVFAGSRVPTLFGSFLNSVSYNNFSLSMNISYKMGYYFLRNSINYSSLFGSRIGHQDYANRWKEKGDELNTNIPSLIYPLSNARETFYQNSEVLVTKGDHIRIQDIKLSHIFQFKNAKSEKARIESFILLDNVGTIWTSNKMNIDPENYTNLFLPPRSITVGVKATF